VVINAVIQPDYQMVVGVPGSGKTICAIKIIEIIASQGNKVLLIA
jgi:KaiC/GvpD/RAD55 family RecA-like ATPase